MIDQDRAQKAIDRRLVNRREQYIYVLRHPTIANRRKRIAQLRFVADYDGYCAYCGEPCKSPTIDHFVPIALGGTDNVDNIVLCCNKCNISKGKKNFIVWLATKPNSNVDKYWNYIVH